MKIGMIGSGNIGGTLARLFVAAGHEVVISNSRGPESLAGLVDELGHKASAATVEDAAAAADLVIEAIPFGKVDTLPAAALAGKVLISASNYYPGRDGTMNLGGLTQTEHVKSLLPDTHVAKAFNTIYFKHLQVEGDPEKPLDERRVLPFAASDETAETAARTLIEQLGFGPLFLGPLPAAKDISEPDGLLYNKQLTLAEAKALVAT